ncbi:hypothetical protein B0H17DRAFT_1129859 [Mycena rosella]|uniref:Uncharacterized protein n=1 Tax=Mycena rosella TaxID=1033263 RepID=A0AAD7GPQ8_MYCRO|nr:hypothetical protein B0H17DRAFT_1129859 [Mycena rosella]
MAPSRILPSPKLRIALRAPSSPRTAQRTRTRLAHLLAELMLTILLSSAVLFAILHLFGFASPRPSSVANPHATAADSSPLAVLRVTALCTLLVYAGVEGGALLLRSLCASPEQDNEAEEGGDYPYDGIEAGWREPFAIVKVYGSVGQDTESVAPFAMAPASPRVATRCAFLPIT